MKKTLAIFRAVFPPWEELDDPLIRREISPGLQISTGAWWNDLFYLCRVISSFVYAFAVLYLLLSSTSAGSHSFPGIKFVLLLGLFLLSLLLVPVNLVGHWKLILGITRCAADLSSVRQMQGNQDLFLVSSLEKSRWYRLNLTALCWQVWPMARNLMVVGGVLALYLFAVTVLFSWGDNDVDRLQVNRCAPVEISEGCDSTYVPLAVWAVAFLPFGLLFAGLPMIESALYASVSLFANVRAKRPGAVIAYSLAGIYGARVVITAVLVYGGLFALIFLSGIGKSPEALLNREISFGAALLMGLVVIFPLAFGIEWLLYAPMYLMLSENTPEDHLILYFWLLFVYVLAYVVASLGMISGLSAAAIRRLDQPER